MRLAGTIALQAVGGWVTIHGRPVFIGDEGGGESLSKADLAKLSYRGGTKAEQDIADKTEIELSVELGIPRTANNKPFDLQNNRVGVEVKTMVSNTNDKITMNKEARERKTEEAASQGLKAFTVVVDKRGGKPRYFVREGFGSFRVHSMTEVKSKAALKRLLGI